MDRRWSFLLIQMLFLVLGMESSANLPTQDQMYQKYGYLAKYGPEIVTRINEIDARIRSLEESTVKSSGNSQNIDEALAKTVEQLLTALNRVEDRIESQEKLFTNAIGECNEKNEALDKEVKNILKRLDDLDCHKPCRDPSRPKEKIFVLHTNAKKSWYKADKYCKINNMTLASVESEEEYNKVLSQVQAFGQRSEGENFWLSGTDLGHKCSFVWTNSNRSVTFDKWHHSTMTPTERAEDCTNTKNCLLLNQEYNDTIDRYYCSRAQFYICEYWQ